MNEWIPVEDRLPAGAGRILIYVPPCDQKGHEESELVDMTWHDPGRALSGVRNRGPVTHWMPLPDPPEDAT